MIRIENLSKSFGDKKVLDSFSELIEDKEHVGISGESGNGKTTLLRIIAGLEKKDSGKLEGYKAEDISFMFQEPRLFSSLTALDNVACVMKGRIKDNREKARAILERLSLSDSLSLYPSELSGGMQRRVALARALVCDRSIVILDEPFESLDETSRLGAIELVKEYCKEKTLLIVSHDKNDIEMLCDREIKI